MIDVPGLFKNVQVYLQAVVNEDWSSLCRRWSTDHGQDDCSFNFNNRDPILEMPRLLLSKDIDDDDSN